MARIPDAFIDELLARTDIVELIHARVPLKKQGREYSARCPFHDERSPSFTVSPSKQFYHCFGCGAHGTAIQFLMQYERLEFLDAIEELAKRAGLQVPQQTRQNNFNPQSQPLFELLDASARHFQNALHNQPDAQAYLQQRGLNADTIHRYGIGFAPQGFSFLRDTLGKNKTALQGLEKAGLLSRSERGQVYDKFRNRIMFPIHDRRGRVIGFGGRIINPEDSPKYLNSPETAVFHKGRELYGLWQARQAHSQLERLIVTEGYMDVVMLAQYGITDAVATLGTATTGEQAELLFRNAADVYFCFDGDSAGRRAAVRAMEAVLPRMRDGRQAFFLFLPDGQDPDSLVRSVGVEGFNAELTQAVPLSRFFFDHYSAGIDLSNLDGKAKLAALARPLLAQIPDGAFADLMQQQLSQHTGLQHIATSAPPPARNAAPTQKPSLVRATITLLLQEPTLGLLATPPFAFADLKQPGIELLIQLLHSIHAQPNLNTAALLQHFAEHPQAAALHRLASQHLPGDVTVWTTEFCDALHALQRAVRQQRISALKSRLDTLNEQEKQQLRALLAGDDNNLDDAN